VLVALTASSQRTQALAASPSDSGIRRTLIDGAGYHCSHSIAISGRGWPNELRLSVTQPRFPRTAERNPSAPGSQADSLLGKISSNLRPLDFGAPPRSKFGVVGKKLPAPRPMLLIPPTGMRAGPIRSGTYNPSRPNHTARRIS
jgi:hypothetical protein